MELPAPPFRSSTFTNKAEVRRLRNRLPSDAGLLNLVSAARGPDASTADIVAADWRLAQELGLQINGHHGQGVFPGRPTAKEMAADGLLGDDVTP